MDALEALKIIKETKEVLEISGEKESIKAIEVAERALKDAWFIDMEYTDRGQLKKDIVELILQRYKERVDRNLVTIKFVKLLLEETIKDLDDAVLK